MISGQTQIIAHIGVPTEGFISPMIYNPWFEAKGIDTVVIPFGCEEKDYHGFLKSVFRLRNIVGALITMPHKIETVKLVDQISTTAKICGACNAVRKHSDGKLIGDMFDGEGFTQGVLSMGRSIKGKNALVLGNGGAGSAIAASLAQKDLKKLGLFDIKTRASELLASKLRKYYPQLDIEPACKDPRGWDIIVNATPAGMKKNDPLPIDLNVISSSTLVGDAVLHKYETNFIRKAKQKGCPTQTGIQMLFHQIPSYLDFFGFPAATPEELRAVAKI